jgi:hypothetical protein
MGAKRIGLGRIEALLENLKRDINWGPQTTHSRASKDRNRYYLEEYFKQRPALNAALNTAFADSDATALANTAIRAAEKAANKDFELQGTRAVTSCAAFSDVAGGFIMTTTTADQDQCIIAPHLDINQTAWTGVKWASHASTEWECSITTSAAIDNQKIWAGLKLSNTSVAITDADSIWFIACSDGTFGSTATQQFATSDNAAMAADGTNMLWHCIYSIGGAFYTTNLGLAVEASTNYHFKIVLDSDRKASVFINGTQYGLVNDTGYGITNAGTANGTWGETNVVIDGASGGSTSTSATTLTVKTTDVRGAFKAGDFVYKADTSVPIGKVKSVDSATSITLETLDATMANDVELFNYGQKATSATQKSKALTTDIDFKPYIGIENGDAAAAELTVHFTAISRALND